MEPSDHPDDSEAIDNRLWRRQSYPKINTFTYDESGRLPAMTSTDPSIDEKRRLIDLARVSEPGWLRPGEENPPPRTEHDREKKLYRITDYDGKTELFRDEPVRFLVVEPDRETGELKPVTYGGLPQYLYLCREEREPRR